MSTTVAKPKRLTVRDIAACKNRTPLVCLTAYTAPVARALDGRVDIILVGDSLGMVLYGMESTVPVTLDMMIAHGRAVVNTTRRSMVVVDMPFGSYQESREQAFGNAVRIMQETGAGAVKLEGGQEMADTVHFLTERGIAVLGHIGLQPQSVHATGGYRVMGRGEGEQKRVIADAAALERAGAFGLVLECVTPDLAGQITAQVKVPTIGIGASAPCDGQILVSEDMLGLTGQRVPQFVKQYSDLYGHIEQAVERYADDVRQKRFPVDGTPGTTAENKTDETVPLRAANE